jgi:anti-sigma regulatory factor (Ser/Thr protein kinase)
MMLQEQSAPYGHADALIRLAALPSAVSMGRRFIKAVLQLRGITELEDDALLCTSELVTNAINATSHVDLLAGSAPDASGGDVVLCAAITERRLRIEVWDISTELPAPRGAGDDEENGRGLALVGAVCDRWGSELLTGSQARGPCKVTWCEWDRAVPNRKLTRLPDTSKVHAADQRTTTAEVHPARHAGRATAAQSQPCP